MDQPHANIQATLAAYEAGINEYLAHSPVHPHPSQLRFMQRVASMLPTGAHMLELGSGPGHDALFFERCGVRVERTDGTSAFVEHLRAQGHNARTLEATSGTFGGPYDVVYAGAVLLHLNAHQLESALARSHGALRTAGLLAFTVKEGEGEAWSTAKLGSPRYFTYWTEAPLRALLERSGWEEIEIAHASGRLEPWLQVTCRGGGDFAVPTDARV